MPSQQQATKCTTTGDTECFLEDPRLFSQYCWVGDYCLDGIEYTDDASIQSPLHTCPLSDDVINRGPFHMSCLYQPRGPLLPEHKLLPEDLQAFLGTASGPGHWDCVRNTWQVSQTSVGVLPPSVGRHCRFDAVATYGDSIAHNVARGLQITLNGNKAARFYHDRNDMAPPLNVSETGAEVDIPNARPRVVALPIAHFCCSLCACKYRLTDAVDHPFDWASKLNSSKLLLVVRTSLHIKDIRKRESLMAHEMEQLLKRAAIFRGEVTVLWIPQHGAGRRKLPEHLALGQDTHSLREYDAAVRNRVLGNKSWTYLQPGLRAGVLDIQHMFQMAETSCDGEYSSLDGTHLSPTVQVNVAQQILRMC
mmetsp:Transcript_38449/g.101402  ORF Transcript_38449/g.101402 Transcript_38449/m.101402 type:complete len:364 (+) Transcript_38449:370-1461(+)